VYEEVRIIQTVFISSSIVLQPIRFNETRVTAKLTVERVFKGQDLKMWTVIKQGQITGPFENGWFPHDLIVSPTVTFPTLVGVNWRNASA
jgi:hypothetical protein